MADAVYIADGQTLRKLSAETGKTDAGFRFDRQAEWQHLLVTGDTLIAAAGRDIFGIDRGNGRTLWARQTDEGRRFSDLAAGGGHVYCLEAEPPAAKDAQKRRGKKTSPKAALTARNLGDGKTAWSQPVSFLSSAIAYAAPRDIVLLGSAAFSGKDGRMLRNGRPASDPLILHGDTLYTQHKKGYNDGRSAGAIDLLTGRPKMAPHPITGTDVLWYFARSHGCSRIMGGEHVLTFRSATTAYYDLSIDGGVTQLVGFRSFCRTGSLIPADGVLNAPNLSACACEYPIYTPMGLVHDPDADAWSHYKISNTPEVNHAYRDAPGHVRRLGLNFGAPGDRRGPGGTLWLDYPSVGGWSFDIPVKTDPPRPEWFQHHASRVVAGGGLKWVQASGSRVLRSVTIDLKGDKPRSYTVRVQYAEPVGDERGNLRGSVVQHRGVKAGRELQWKFAPGKWVCGIEIIEE
jgi:hypothetical protein